MMELAILIIVVVNLIVSIFHRSEMLRGIQYNSDTITRVETKIDKIGSVAVEVVSALKDKEDGDAPTH